MKNYVKNLIWQQAVGVTAVLAILALVMLPAPAKGIVPVLLLLSCAGYFYLNYHVLMLFRKYSPTSFFQDMGKRNMRGIAVGGTAGWLNANLSAGDVYDALGVFRSFEMNFAVLKTYWSHLREHGTVYFIADIPEMTEAEGQVSPSDFYFVHAHYFLKTGVSRDKKREFNPLVFDRDYSFRFLKAAGQKNRGDGAWALSGSAPEITEAAVKQYADRLKEVAAFCEDRELKLRVILPVRREKDREALEKLRGMLGGSASFDAVTASDAAEMNQQMRG